MRLCLVRHAIAVERGLPGFADDGSRPLTPKGRERMREAAEGLRALLPAGAVFSSPLVRARETAEILLDVFDLAEMHVSDALANGNHEALLADVNTAHDELVFAVGHEPYISEALSLALTGDPAGLSVLFKKGAAALVEFSGPAEAGRGMLEWLLQPGQLRSIAGHRGDHA